MRFEKYMIEQMITGAFFISPKGELIGAGAKKHINIIIDDPKKFGYTDEKIKKIFFKYNEKMGQEGKAREEIILDLIKKGWIHLRRRPNKYWIINADRMTKKVRDVISDWSKKILKGIKGVKEVDKYMDVKIMTMNGQYSRNLTIDDIANKYALQESKDKKIEHKIII